jgi:hypothetical protein
MTSLALLQLSTFATNNRCEHASRKLLIPRSSRPTGLGSRPRYSNIARPRARIARIQVHASSQPPFGSGGGGSDSDVKSLVSDLALPVGALALLLIAGPFFGGATAIFGLPIIVTAAAAVFGTLDFIAGLFGTTPLVAAGIVASSTFGILLIPAFLKFGFIAFAGYFVANLLFGGGGGDSDPDVTAGTGSSENSYYTSSGSNRTYNNTSEGGRNSFDARDVTIDVEADTIDD